MSVAKLLLDDLKHYSDFIEVVDEPSFSKSQLKAYQQKYHYLSSDLYQQYMHATTDEIAQLSAVIGSDNLQDWLFNYESFKRAGGSDWDLSDNPIASNM